MPWIRILLTVIAYIFMGGVIILIGRTCWKDSKEDFRMVFRDVRNMFKKKKAD